jgi:Flp pilus assembly protein TadD
MQDNVNEELFRIPDEDPIPMDQMSKEEIELRKLLHAFSNDPDDPQTLISVAKILMSKNLYDEARLYLEPYVEKVPDDPEALNCLGIINFINGASKEAEPFFDRALQLDPNLRDAIYNIAMLYSERGDFEQAREQFEHLARLEGDNPEVFNNLGAFLYQAGDLDGAEERFRQALDLDPRHSAALRNLIETLIDTGRLTEAEKHLKVYESIHPQAEELEKLAQRIEKPSSVTEEPCDEVAAEPDLALSASMVGRELASGLKIGIVSDWCPSDRGELAYWLRTSLEQSGHRPYVLARTGKVPHCKDKDRDAYPRCMGRWVVPDLTLSSDSPLKPELYERWLKSIRPDAVVFVDEQDEKLIEITRKNGASAMACPAFVGATYDTAAGLSAFDRVIATSPWVQEQCKGKIPADRLINTDLGIDMDRFKPCESRERETVFLFDAGHGAVEDLENLLVMFTAFGMMNREAAERSKLLVRTHVDWNLFPDEIRNRGEGQPNIDVVSGQLEDHRFLAMGDVLVHLRLSSGLHCMVPEAAACGIPSIVVDRSPATGWIFDEHMILKVPRTSMPDGADLPSITADVKTLSDTLGTLATDPEMVDYMGGVCREKTRQLLDGVERSRVLCDKVVTALTAKNDRYDPPSPPTEQGSDHLLEAIENAIAEGKNTEAKELMARFRQTIG